MEKIYEFTDNNTINEEAGAWLMKLDGDTPPSSQDLRELKVWLDRSPVHREKLGQLTSFWNNLDILTDLSVPLEKPEPQLKSFSLFNSMGTWLTGNKFAAASGAFVLAGITLVAFISLQLNAINANNGVYSTEIGQLQTVQLADGSSMQLNTRSRLRVEYSENYRDIYLLKGEAHFDVAKNPDLPFRVFAGSGRVQAVGTAFTVHLQNDDINVTVTEGKVALAALSVPVTNTTYTQAKTKPSKTSDLGILNAGQRVTIKSDTYQNNHGASLGSIETLAQAELNKRLSWREGLLTFSGEPLETVVKEISRYTAMTIEMPDPSVRAIKIGGQFEAGDTEMMFHALEASFGLRIEHVAPTKVRILAANE
jgi:transmembrane sensor